MVGKKAKQNELKTVGVVSDTHQYVSSTMMDNGNAVKREKISAFQIKVAGDNSQTNYYK